MDAVRQVLALAWPLIGWGLICSGIAVCGVAWGYLLAERTRHKRCRLAFDAFLRSYQEAPDAVDSLQVLLVALQFWDSAPPGIVWAQPEPVSSVPAYPPEGPAEAQPT